MTTQHFPSLDAYSIGETKNALQAYARVMGAWLKACRPNRKHWWHASLRPSLSGLTTGVIHGGVDIEMELNLRDGLLLVHTANGENLSIELLGQPATELAKAVEAFLIGAGIDNRCIPQGVNHDTDTYVGYAAKDAYKLSRAINASSAAMSSFRASIGEETSPIQLWPHHFDLSMLWLPGEKIPGQDPDNEEYSDKQMNFGFAFGDETIPEPYFYVTAYPLPDTFPALALPSGSRWQTEGFSGVVVLYQSLLQQKDPKKYLIKLWTHLLSAGRSQMLNNGS